MNLRQRKFDDHWRHVSNRTYPTRFVQVSFQNLKCLADDTITFVGGINAVIGSNGAGKSTLVAGMSELLANGAEVAPGHRRRLKGSVLEATVFQSGAEVHLKVEDDPELVRKSTGPRFEGTFRWLDPSYLANRCVNQIYDDQNFGDLLEPITALDLNSDELDLVSYLVNRKYDELAIYEIADYGGLELFPYFRVSSDGVVYTSERMGRGELCLLLAYWILRNAPRNSILILEEPETHVSPKSQESLMNILAKFSDELAISCILATHSPAIISRIPREQIKLLTRARPASKVVSGPKHVQIATILGGGVAFRGALLVEDEEAKGFVLTILEELDSDLFHQLEVIKVGSEPDITKVLTSMPVTGDWLTVVGAYDGDQRSKSRETMQWPFVFLPSNLPPSQLFKHLLEETNGINAKLAVELQKNEQIVALALDSVTGTDHHDLVEGLSHALNSTVATVRRGLVRVWLTDTSNMEQAANFVKEVRDTVNSTRRN